jgi:hypothetical protein
VDFLFTFLLDNLQQILQRQESLFLDVEILQSLVNIVYQTQFIILGILGEVVLEELVEFVIGLADARTEVLVEQQEGVVDIHQHFLHCFFMEDLFIEWFLERFDDHAHK